MLKREIAGGLGLLSFAALYMWGATLIPHSSLSDEVGARGMPLLLGGLLAFVATAILARAWSMRAAPQADAGSADDAPLPRVLGLLCCAGLYILIAWLTGFVIASAVTLFAVSVYEGAPVNLRTLGVAIIGAAAFWLVFVKFLNVAQPIGLIFGS